MSYQLSAVSYHLMAASVKNSGLRTSHVAKSLSRSDGNRKLTAES